LKFPRGSSRRLSEGPADPTWDNDPAVNKWRALIWNKYYPDGDKANANNLYGYVRPRPMVQVLKQVRHTLTRENVMKQARTSGISLDLMLAGHQGQHLAGRLFSDRADAAHDFNGEAWEFSATSSPASRPRGEH